MANVEIRSVVKANYQRQLSFFLTSLLRRLFQAYMSALTSHWFSLTPSPLKMVSGVIVSQVEVNESHLNSYHAIALSPRTHE